MKYRYRLIILILIFIASVWVFSMGMTERFFNNDASTVEMSEASLPLVTMSVSGCEINLLHGYTSKLDEMQTRDTITPLGGDRTFTVLIDEKKPSVKKLKYEIFESNGGELESGELIVLDEGGDRREVTIAVAAKMLAGNEYVARLTLITGESKRIYYYTRFKLYDDAKLTEKLAFVQYFHEVSMNPDRIVELATYLESSSRSDRSSFEHVDIESAEDMISWGTIRPKEIFCQVPTVTEFYDGPCCVVLNYCLEAETDSGTEHYMVEERYRFTYGEKRTYLYNYERDVRAIYDVALTSLSKNELKLGITTENDPGVVASSSENYVAFVYDGDLICFNREKNEVTVAFSFKSGDRDYLREYYDDHDIEILSITEEGDIDFLVYGYMNSGAYEGRVCMVLYRYYAADNRIEEQLYIPVNTTASLLRENMNGFVYRNDYGKFYFYLYRSIFEYDLTTGNLRRIDENIDDDKIVYSKSCNFVAWQESREEGLAEALNILNLETGEQIVIAGQAGETITLLGNVSENLIYGYAKISDRFTDDDGNEQIPCYKLVICDATGDTLKSYAKEGFYILNVLVDENIITLNRVCKDDNANFIAAPEDTILNRQTKQEASVGVSKRITEKTLTEYYIALGSKCDIVEIPKLVRTANTVIEDDTTLLINEPEKTEQRYYTYSFGRLVKSSKLAADCIISADENVGTVIDSEGHVVWERGIKTTKASISGIIPAYVDSTDYDSLQAAIAMILDYKSVEADASGFNSRTDRPHEWLSRYMKAKPLDLVGITLDEALYYVYRKRPVIAVTGDAKAVLITGYDATGIDIIDPANRRNNRMQKSVAENLFEKNGNMFYSYVD